MKKRTPVPAYMLLLTLSNKLEIFFSHSITPCRFTLPMASRVKQVDFKVLSLIHRCIKLQLNGGGWGNSIRPFLEFFCLFFASKYKLPKWVRFYFEIKPWDAWKFKFPGWVGLKLPNNLGMRGSLNFHTGQGLIDK